MVAVCVVANTVFPVIVSIQELPNDSARLQVQVRQESGELTTLELSEERSSQIRTKHGAQFDTLAGLSWRQFLAEL